MNIVGNIFDCMICGENMFPIKRFTTGRGKILRLKCTCGHYEDVDDKDPSDSPHDFEQTVENIEQNNTELIDEIPEGWKK